MQLVLTTVVQLNTQALKGISLLESEDRQSRSGPFITVIKRLFEELTPFRVYPIRNVIHAKMPNEDIHLANHRNATFRPSFVK